MKKPMSIILTIVMMMSTLCVSSFAEDVAPALSGNSEHNSVVTYTVEKPNDPTYTVTIPATISLGQDVGIAVDANDLRADKFITVTLSDTSYEDGRFVLVSENADEMVYTVYNNTAETGVSAGEVVLTVIGNDNNPSAKGSVSLTFRAPTGGYPAGTYEGTVTFTVAIADAQ